MEKDTKRKTSDNRGELWPDDPRWIKESVLDAERRGINYEVHRLPDGSPMLIKDVELSDFDPIMRATIRNNLRMLDSPAEAVIIESVEAIGIR